MQLRCRAHYRAELPGHSRRSDARRQFLLRRLLAMLSRIDVKRDSRRVRIEGKSNRRRAVVSAPRNPESSVLLACSGIGPRRIQKRRVTPREVSMSPYELSRFWRTDIETPNLFFIKYSTPP